MMLRPKNVYEVMLIYDFMNVCEYPRFFGEHFVGIYRDVFLYFCICRLIF
jgi:hypothetical protein